MAIAEELIAILGFKVEGQQNLRKYKRGLDGAEKTTKKSALTMNRMGLAASAVGAGMLAAGGIAFASARKFAGLEREMNRIGITAGASGQMTSDALFNVQRLADDMALPIAEVVGGLDTLVATGMSLDEAMSFLPAVAATAQASGASLVDIANTAQKTADALKIPAAEMQRAFDIMVTGGEDGQFELKDMAQFIPTLANQFANLGTTGEEGLKQLIAVMQTLREDTGSAGQAATQARNIISKMFSDETNKKFGKFGIDLRKELKDAAAAGENLLDTFIELSREAVDGDLTKIPQLFTDVEFQQGMTSLITSEESLQRFLASLNSADVDGTVFRNLGIILDDTEAKMTRLATKWDRLSNSFGKAAAHLLDPILTSAVAQLDRDEAIQRELSGRGQGLMGFAVKSFTASNEELDQLARQGGFAKPGEDAVQIKLESDARQALREQLNGINTRLADMASGATLQADITDASQDNRDQSVNPNVSITQYVQQATDAALAAANVTGSAVSNAVTEQARIAQEPATAP